MLAVPKSLFFRATDYSFFFLYFFVLLFNKYLQKRYRAVCANFGCLNTYIRISFYLLCKYHHPIYICVSMIEDEMKKLPISINN